MTSEHPKKPNKPRNVAQQFKELQQLRKLVYKAELDLRNGCPRAEVVDPRADDNLEREFERRSVGRAKVSKGALIFFSEQIGVRSCCVTDITKIGAGIRTQDLAALPLNFELSFDNFRTVRKCSLAWRDGDFIGVAFEN